MNQWKRRTVIIAHGDKDECIEVRSAVNHRTKVKSRAYFKKIYFGFGVLCVKCRVNLELMYDIGEV